MYQDLSFGEQEPRSANKAFNYNMSKSQLFGQKDLNSGTLRLSNNSFVTPNVVATPGLNVDNQSSASISILRDFSRPRAKTALLKKASSFRDSQMQIYESSYDSDVKKQYSVNGTLFLDYDGIV